MIGDEKKHQLSVLDESGELPHLLALLHSALEGVTTLEAEYRDWDRPPPSRSLAIESEVRRDGVAGPPKLRWRGAGPFPRPTENRRRLWLMAPDRLRVTIARDRQVVQLGVRDGVKWWRWSQFEGASRGDGNRTSNGRGLPPLLDPPLLCPVRMLSRFRLADVAAARRAGRRVVTVSGVPRQRILPGPTTRRYELEFDAEHGTMLRMAVYDRDQCLHLTEAIGITYGLELDPDLFTWPGRSEAPVAGPSYERDAVDQRDRNRDEHVTSTPGCSPTVWLTGLPGAGKTTLARALETQLRQRGLPSCLLDGDELRAGLSSDLGLSRADRAEQARRVAHVATIVAATGTAPVVALVSPYAEDRRRARAIHESAGVPFVEVWVNTPADVCAARDPKGLYARARDGSLTGLTGRDAPYQAPQAPDLEVSGYATSPEAVASSIVRAVFTIADEAAPP